MAGLGRPTVASQYTDRAHLCRLPDKPSGGPEGRADASVGGLRRVDKGFTAVLGG